MVTAAQTPSRTAGFAAREVFAGEAVGRNTMSDLLEGDLGLTPMPFTLEVTGYTSPQEADRYAQILAAQGQEGLLEALGGRNMGFFRLQGQPDQPIIFVQQRQDQTGRRTISVLTRRWLNQFIEGYQNKAVQFPFAYIELSIDHSGKADGTMYVGASVKFTHQTANIVNVACYDARVVIANNEESIIGVQDYADDRDWLKNIRSNRDVLVREDR
jgi:hypothetical protein